VDADDLARQARELTGLGWPLASRLIQLGHAEQVQRQAGRGDWSCARELAWFLAGQDRHAEAVELLAAYAATGWWTAVEAMAELLEHGGRGDEAIALAGPYAKAGERIELNFFARLLARHGRADEAFTLLRPSLLARHDRIDELRAYAAAGWDETAMRCLAEMLESAVTWRARSPCTGSRGIRGAARSARPFKSLSS
jgi:hypothetical protein